jgi:serine/threonine protein kinase
LAAEILSALEYLHGTAYIIHRDLKSENILVFTDGHIALSDFGTCTIANETTPRTPFKAEFVGTAEFLPPELITDTKICYASDFWSFGILLYQLIEFKLPFRAASEFLAMRKIKDYTDGSLQFSDRFTPLSISLINDLVRSNPADRLGFLIDADVLRHKFFEGLSLERLSTMKSPLLRYLTPL